MTYYNITLLSNPKNNIFGEEYALDELEYYIKEIKYNYNLQNLISHNLLTQFIKNDDNHLDKLLRNLLIIKKRNQEKLVLKNLHKWFMNLYSPYKIEQKKEEEIIENIVNKSINKDEKVNKYNNSNNNIYKEKISKNKKLLNNLLKQKINKDNVFHNKINISLSCIKRNNSYNNISPKKMNKILFSIENTIFNNSMPNFCHTFKINNSCEKPKNEKKAEIKDIKKNNISKNFSLIKGKEAKEKASKFCSSYKGKNKLRKIKKNILAEKNLISSRNDSIKKNNKNTTNKNMKKCKKITDKIIRDFILNLKNNEKNREEKMIKLYKEHEVKINSIYTFSPKLISNKNNKKYFNKLVDKLFINNIIDSINIKITNNNQIGPNNYENMNNNTNQLDIVLEENRKQNNFNFMLRLSEYEKRKKNNLEKIKNDIYIDEKKKFLENIFYNNDEKYNIEEYHLLNSTYSYFINKKRNIEKLTKNIFDEQGITFEPKINNEYNQKIIQNYNFLNNEANLNKKNEKIFEYLSNKDKECTFQPKINDNIFEGNNNNNNEINVSERLFGYQNKYKEKLKIKKEKYFNFTFKPAISKNTKMILNKRKLLENLKENIKNNLNESKRGLLLNKKENDKNKEMIEGEIKNDDNNLEDSKPNEILNNIENIAPIITNFSNIINNNEKYVENKGTKRNKFLEIKLNNINFSKNNDYKTFNKNNSKKIDNKDNNKKIMDFEYYNNII